MRPERYQEVDLLLARALDVEPRDRQSFLARECSDRPETFAQVQRLLAADLASRSFLETPSPANFFELPPFVPGGRLGNYRLEAEIGRGGMGTVYLARRDDGQYQRQVAIKQLHRVGLGEDGRSRFRDERQILAGLEHPHIARLYDAGELPGGDAFLVMEYVEGEPISTYCDRLKLSLEARLRLFLKVLQAVGYAHQNLLVHRDLKPENILVDASGEPKLIDFGIAKQLAAEEGASASTRLSQRFMTPRYASPEQVRGERISVASDVYSLGVVLYELLVGQGPYRLEALLPHQISQAVLEQIPLRPSEALRGLDPDAARQVATCRDTTPAQLVRGLIGDLDTIVLASLAKEPRRRYGTVAELAADLERHLAGFPILARGSGLSYRVTKFVARHRAAVIAAGAALLTVAGFLAHAVVERSRADRERVKAEQALGFLVETFRNLDPRKNGGEQLTVAQLLATAADRLANQSAEAPEVRATLMDTLGDAHMGLGLFEPAAKLLEGALVLRQERASRDPGALGDSLMHLGMLRYRQGDLDASEELLRRAVCAKRRLFGARRLELAEPLNLLGFVLASRSFDDTQRPLEDIAALHREALALAAELEGPSSLGVAVATLYLAGLEERRGDLEAAERLHRQALGIQLRLSGESSTEAAINRMALAKTLIARGRLAAAEAELQAALGPLALAFPETHPDVRVALHELGRIKTRQGKDAEAEVLLRKVLAADRATSGAEHPDTVNGEYSLAMALLGQEKFGEALELHQHALEMRRQVFGAESVPVAQSLGALARTLSALGEHARALELARQALELNRALYPPGHAELAWPLRNLGDVLLAQAQPAAAEPWLQQSLEILERTRPEGDFQTAWVKVLLGKCLVAMERFESAKTLLEAGTSTLAGQFSEEDRRVVAGRRLLAVVASLPGQPRAVVREKGPAVLGTEAVEQSDHAGRALGDGKGRVGAAHPGLHPTGVQSDTGETFAGKLQG